MSSGPLADPERPTAMLPSGALSRRLTPRASLMGGPRSDSEAVGHAVIAARDMHYEFKKKVLKGAKVLDSS